MKRLSILCALAVAAAVTSCARAPVVPPALWPPPDEVLAMVVPAKGVQIYECRDAKWVFVAPEAELFDRDGRRIGRHFAGPHWESVDGSRIVANVKSRADAPEPGAVPWLLLTAKSVGSEGAFSRVTSVQRVSTHGGAAPAGGCAQPGEQARVAYTADYYLFVPLARSY